MNSYEPDQDSFLFLDALEKEYSFIRASHPSFIVEIGPGSGIISTFLSKLIRIEKRIGMMYRRKQSCSNTSN